jgi:flagellin-like hook-associated protein FlgL
MSIAPFNASTYVGDRNTANLVGLKGRLDTLTNQLASGKAATTYGGLGVGRTTSLSAHAALAALDGYDAAITGATTRVALANTSVTQVNTLGATLQRSLTASNASTATDTSKIARDSLDAAIDALNVDLGGQYIFGGRATDSPPVAATDAILNGEPAAGRDGLKTLIAEQKAADLGPNANGRIAASAAGAGNPQRGGRRRGRHRGAREFRVPAPLGHQLQHRRDHRRHDDQSHQPRRDLHDGGRTRRG